MPKESLILFANPASTTEYIILFAIGDFKSRTCIKTVLKSFFNHFTYSKTAKAYSLYVHFKTEVGRGASANQRAESLEDHGPCSDPGQLLHRHSTAQRLLTPAFPPPVTQKKPSLGQLSGALHRITYTR